MDFIVPDQEPAATRDSSKRKLLTPRRCVALRRVAKVTHVENLGSVAQTSTASQPFHDQRGQFVSSLSTMYARVYTKISSKHSLAK